MSTEKKGYTEADVKEWKQKYGDVHLIEVPDEKEPEKIHTAIVRKPRMKDLQHAMAVAKKAGEDISMLITLFRDCVVYQDDAIAKDEGLFLSVATKMGDIVHIAEASIKKL